MFIHLSQQVPLNTNKISALEAVLSKSLGERVSIITNEIADIISRYIPTPCQPKFNLYLSNISFSFIKPVEEINQRKSKFKNFFIVTASCGTRMEVSECKKEQGSAVRFSQRWNFEEVTTEDLVKIKLFYLKLENKRKPVKIKSMVRSVNIIYEDPLLRKYEEREVLKSSFKLCAEVVLNRCHLMRNHARLSMKSDEYLNLKPVVYFHLKR
ncbi:hypothetical protein GWI33_019594 [Rhynchophorus ferrugineus]|uniref:Uncharacterized protein n=1 Tax=Rhynchophorus ferrugineus TaxID=354439 RepID=A0A834HTF4_RHYFE|nr:hypothetical protein GWI33_019594 [Rhynchophorus ferrugineus]